MFRLLLLYFLALSSQLSSLFLRPESSSQCVDLASSRPCNMGRRRERTKWSQVHWIQERKSCERGQRGPGISGSPAEQRKYRRNLALLAPRFAKSFAAAVENSGEQFVSADCSIEELPDGFTKIRYGFQEDLLLSILHLFF